MKMKGADKESVLEISIAEGFSGAEKLISLRGVDGEKRISLKIPAGIRQGEKIKLAGQGEPGINGGPRGDLYLRVEFRRDTVFELKDLDLEARLQLYPWDAALGAEKPFNTLDGRISVRIPSGVQTDSKIRVAGRGYRDKSGRRGDLFLRVVIVNPPRLVGNNWNSMRNWPGPEARYEQDTVKAVKIILSWEGNDHGYG